ncbi:MAG: transglycosylase domain-containing protein [Clostridiales bacterium]|nr:transglycosylase domain-containing protein [Clostridiales bacterium]
MSEHSKPSEPASIFSEFDRLSDGFKKTTVYNASDFEEADKLTPLQQRRKTRKERLEEEKSGKWHNILAKKIKALVSNISTLAPRRKAGSIPNAKTDMRKKSPKKKKRIRVVVIRLILAVFCLFLLCGIGASAYVYKVIKDVPEIDPTSIYSMLAENSVMYDDSGAVIENIYNSRDGKRTNIVFAEMPEDLYNAFIAIEDKTFWTHSGFNMIRMAGAIRDSLFGGGKISGTSTITQQLARNLFIPDKRFERSLERKIVEAYYTLVIEKHLTKKQIVEAYLNTIFLGFRSSGVQAASQAYFSKNVSELTLIECVALAAIPQQPTAYALIKEYANDDAAAESDEAMEGDDNILVKGSASTYMYNIDASAERRNLILKFMKEQGYIDEARYRAALADDLRDHIAPYQDAAVEYDTSYFSDYVQKKVVEDLMKAYGYDKDEAERRLYNNGLRIYSTLNTATQKIVEAEFSDNANFPKVANLKRDKAGNILGQNGNILLYKYSNYFDDAGNFNLDPSEYEMLGDGSLKLYANARLNIYRTESRGNVDYSIEFKNMYIEKDSTFYSIGGGYVSIPREYKSRDTDGNVVISSQFFAKNPNFFTQTDAGLSLPSSNYSLKQAVVQPQSAMVITDYKTGHIRAMVGGRQTVGRLLFNRAGSPRQPGSSIKPMGVYGPALQSGVDALQGGSSQNYQVPEEGEEGEVPAGNMYGNYWTAASVIDDAPLISGGRAWPKNWYAGYRGLHTMRRAVEQSVNVCAVKVFNEVGYEYSYQFLKKLGITSIVDTGPTNDMNPAALALGGMTNGISPLEMAGGYGAFANQGVYVEPIAYTKVTNKYGEVILDNIPVTTQAMDAGVAFIMTDILRSTVSAGIAGQAAIGIQPVAGKTGTTTDNFDAWFVGLTPQYAASLWIGNDVSIELSTGSVAASKLWSKIMKQVCTGLPAGSFASAPSNVTSATVDTMSGKAPSDISALDPRGTVRSEYFINGTQPTAIDDIHTYVSICSKTGYLATPLCTELTSAFGVQRPYFPDPAVGDISYEVPHLYCFLHNPDMAEYPVSENTDVQYNWVGRDIVKEPDELADPELEQPPDNPVGVLDYGEWDSPGSGTSEQGSSSQGSPGQGTSEQGNTGQGDYLPPPDSFYDDMPENLRPF